MKEIPFSNVLTALTDVNHNFSARYLPRFSDLEPEDVKAFMKVWPKMPLKRKLNFLRGLNDRFVDDNILSFEAIGAAVLTDEDADVRVVALQLLYETINLQLLPTLIKLLESDPVVEVRTRAATVLGQFVRLFELDELPDSKRELLEDVLFKAARDPQATVARAALESLGFSSRPELKDLILTALKHPDPLWQAAALFAAGRSSDNRWEEQILNGLLSEDAPVRLAAVQSVGILELKSARKILLELLEDETDDDVFQALIWTLSQVGGEDVRTYLEALLDQAEDIDEIEFFEEALENLSFTEDMQKFELLAVDPDDSLEDKA